MKNLSIQLEIDALTTIDIFSFTGAIILGLLFLTIRTENRRANIFLCLFLFSLAGEVLSVLMEPLFESAQSLFQTSLFTLPLLLYYIKVTTNSRVMKFIPLLFIPGITVNVLQINVMPLEYIFNITILIYILKTINKHQRELKSFYSSLEMITLNWIRIIAFIFLCFHAIWITEDLIGFQTDWFDMFFVSLSSGLTLFVIIWIGHNGLAQPEIFKQKLFINKHAKPNDNNDKVLKTHIDTEEWIKLKSTIESKQLYTNPKLNLRSLSATIGINEKEVSRLINQYGKYNFYQFINQFRVEAFKQSLSTERAKQLSLFGLAEEVGFNSKSTFYSTFKAIEGKTPKQFQVALIKSEQKQTD